MADLSYSIYSAVIIVCRLGKISQITKVTYFDGKMRGLGQARIRPRVDIIWPDILIFLSLG